MECLDVERKVLPMTIWLRTAYDIKYPDWYVEYRIEVAFHQVFGHRDRQIRDSQGKWKHFSAAPY